MHRRFRQGQRGGALTELALLTALVMVPTFYYIIVFFDISLARIKLQEAARFVAWEFTIMEVSDWMNANHDGRFTNTLMPNVKNKVRTTYGDDMNSISPRFLPATGQAPLLAFNVEFQDGDFKVESKDPQVFNLAGTSFGSDAANFVLGDLMKFNTKGMIYADVGLTLKNRTVPIKSMKSFVGDYPLLTSDTLKLMPARVVILADAWDIKDGAEVVEDRADEVGYGRQVGRTAFMGIFSNSGGVGSALDSIGDVLEFVNIDMPTRAERLVTKPYSNRNLESGKTGNLSVVPNDRCSDCNPNDGGSPQKKFHTAELRLGKSYNSGSARGEYIKTFKDKFGNFYMNCPQEQKADNECTY